jgi:hypothetical protein
MEIRLNTIQKRNNLNEVVRVDKKGPGGGFHTYRVYAPGMLPGGEDAVRITEINFQKGPRNSSDSVRGVLDGDLLEIVRDRLSAFQQGEYATRENEMALNHIEEALMWINKRAEDRAERNVLGTMKK